MTEAGGERTDPSPLSSGTGSRSESDWRKSVEDAAERYLDKLQRGDDTGGEPADASDPEIALALARRLRVIERLHRAGQALSTHGASATRRRLRCPHCGHLLTLPTDEGAPSASGSSVGAAARDVVCPSCGSSFHVSEEPSPRRALEDLPRTVGRFTVKQLLGRGAFGNVYKALDEELDRSVAVKVPRAGYFGAKEDEERFLREARSAARLRHPGIVAVHEIGNDRGVPYIVSEFVESRTLAELIAESRPGFRESAALTASIAEALDFAHAQGVVHRDIKPGNLLIDRAGQPHISDFGLARRGDEDVTVTIDGQILGTPAYMSPEQALGDTAKVGPRSDQYSLGVVLYELLTGERPFRGSKSMLLEQVIRDEPRPPRRLNDHIPQDLETICLKALAKDPAARYASARAFAEDLRRYLRGEPIEARAVSRLERVVRWSRRNPLTASLSSALAVLLVAAVVITSVLAVHRARALDVAQDRLSRLNVATGASHAARGDYLGALPWYAEAYSMDAEGSERAWAHSLRLESTLLQGPRLAHTIFHPPQVKRVQFSADGRLLTVRGQSRMSVLDLESGREEAVDTPVPPDGAHHALSRDGRTLITSAAGGRVRAWNPFIGATKLELQHAPAVTWAGLSPSERLIATGGADRSFRLWDAATGEAIGSPLDQGAPAQLVIFSEDETRILTAGSSGPCKVWEVPTGRQITTGPPQPLQVKLATVSPDGRWIVTAGDERMAKVWDAATGVIQLTLGGFGNSVFRARFSPDGTLVAAAAGDGTVRVWEVATGRQLGAIIEHVLGIPDLAFNPDGRTLATGSFDGTARIWDSRTGKEVGPPLFHPVQLDRVIFSPEGRRLATQCMDGSVRVWDFAAPGFRTSTCQFPQWCEVAALSPDRRSVAVGKSTGEVTVFNVETWAAARTFAADRGKLRAIAWSPDSAWVATVGDSRSVGVWSASPEHAVDRVVALPASGQHVAFSIDGKQIAVGSSKNGAYLVSLAGSAPDVKTLQHSAPIRRVAFRPGGRWLVGGGADGKLCAWDLTSLSPVLTVQCHERVIVSMGFSIDGSLVATASDDREARVWNLATGREALPPMAHSVGLTYVQFSPDGERLLTASHDGAGRLWSARDGTLLSPDLRHRGGILTADFSRDGKLLALGSFDRSVSIWDTQRGEEVTPQLRHRYPLVLVAFGADDRTVVTVPQAGPGGSWTLPDRVRPASDLRLLAHLLAGRRVDGAGGFFRLKTEEFRGAWDVLRQKSADAFEVPRSAVITWHREQLELSELDDVPHGTLVHAQTLLQLGEATASDRILLALSKCALGDYAGGAAQFAAVEASRPLEGWELHRWAIARWLAGDAAGAADVARIAIGRYGATTNAALANSVAWIAGSLPRCPIDYEPFVRLGRIAAASDPREASRHHTCGVVLLRAGDFAGAIQELEEAARLDQALSRVWAASALAVACREAGRDVEARAWLARMEEEIQQPRPAMDRSRIHFWADRPILDNYVREARGGR